MPELTRFYGIIIKMFFRNTEHEPPHVHVSKEWHETHKNELLDMWNNQPTPPQSSGVWLFW
jgi:hypothetical protein